MTGRVLIACEFSGIVRRAFSALGYDAWSCDLRRAEDGSNRHYTGDVRDILYDGWDMLIVAHPPCTRLCNSGVRWLSAPPSGRTLAEMWAELDEGAALFSTLWNAPVPRVAVENPVMHKHAKERIVGYRPAAQSVQPWEYGDWETKRTCLWLRGLPRLVPTYATLAEARAGLGLADDAQPVARVHRMAPGADRAKERSRFFGGVAAAMADQWGNLLDVRAAA
ncbi:hypothetical protein [Novosphingobium humi]|uniref:hypothetical protein n=1 Tax=Novosphingobium humi TaxID=2282397 RepID=UPI0025B23268|nr:hypothetical protein [Novosphingobium humi]WJS97817.1 hypothetical protein NYQ05_11805 [Novosphingobium humi]